MTERPTADFPEGPVDRLEEPEPRSPWRRAVVAVVVVVVVGGGVLTRALSHNHGDEHGDDLPHAALRAPPAPDPGLNGRSAADPGRGSTGDGLSATGRITGNVTAGDTLQFDVTLHSDRLLSLRPCPAYTITFGTHTTRGRLSCSQVPYLASLVRADGTVSSFQPVLPAGTEIAFRMHVRAPDEPGLRRVRWALQGRPRAALSGVVVVVAPGPR